MKKENKDAEKLKNIFDKLKKNKKETKKRNVKKNEKKESKNSFEQMNFLNMENNEELSNIFNMISSMDEKQITNLLKNSPFGSTLTEEQITIIKKTFSQINGKEKTNNIFFSNISDLMANMNESLNIEHEKKTKKKNKNVPEIIEYEDYLEILVKTEAVKKEDVIFKIEKKKFLNIIINKTQNNEEYSINLDKKIKKIKENKIKASYKAGYLVIHIAK